jgi:beta-lactamase superfamily II metal-dependent hydrolase
VNKNQLVDDVRNLLLEVYTIGYPEQGESQVILIKEKSSGIVYFSCVIDCFSNQVNKTIDILKDSEVKALNYFIWTHTDEDHSIGIDDIIDGFCLQDTVFIIPEGIYGNERELVNYNSRIKSTFEKIHLHNNGIRYNVNTATVIKGQHSRIFYKKYIDKVMNEIVFEIIAIAPVSALYRRRYKSGEIKKKNDLSIATLFKINDLSLLFSGDMEDQTIRLIPDSYFDHLSYIKTPHHTSSSSTELITKIDSNFQSEKIPTAVSTVYKRHNLPDMSVVEEYKKYVNLFYSTGIGNELFGYVKTVFDVVNKEILSERCFGNAYAC